jgi:general secretion pathway protein I
MNGVPSHREGKQAGFSLLEVLVAFSILALSMGTLMQIFSGGLRNVGLSEEYARAVAIAEEQLVSIGIESALTPGENRGKYGEKFSWYMVAQPIEGNLLAEQASPQGISPVLPMGLMGISVTVEWDSDATNRRSLTLNTARVFAKTP